MFRLSLVFIPFVLLWNVSMGFIPRVVSRSRSIDTTTKQNWATQQQTYADFGTTAFKRNPNNEYMTWKTKSWENSVFEAEMDLKQAMLYSDIETLDELLDDKMLFVNHLDQAMGKRDDIEAHRMGAVQIDSIELSSWNVEMIAMDGRPNLALVTVDEHIIGSLAGYYFEDTLRFRRVWQRKGPNRWQVIEGDSSLLIAD